MVDPHTAVYFALALIALAGIGILVYARVFLLDPPKRKSRRKRH
jgi:hypothetical protein